MDCYLRVPESDSEGIMKPSSANIRENVELDENWQPKRIFTRIVESDGIISRFLRNLNRLNWRGIVEALAPLWFALFFLGVTLGLVRIMVLIVGRGFR